MTHDDAPIRSLPGMRRELRQTNIDMTIRERMQRRVRRTVFYCGVIAVGGAAGLVHYPLRWGIGLLVAWWLISLAIIVGVMWRTRCPVCNTVLGAKTRSITKDKPTLDNCPHCGVNFDQPMGSATSVQ